MKNRAKCGSKWCQVRRLYQLSGQIISRARLRRSSARTSASPNTIASQKVMCLLLFYCENVYFANVWKCWHVNDTDAKSYNDKCENISNIQSSFRWKIGAFWAIGMHFISTKLLTSCISHSLSGSWPEHRRPKHTLNWRFNQSNILPISLRTVFYLQFGNLTNFCMNKVKFIALHFQSKTKFATLSQFV